MVIQSAQPDVPATPFRSLPRHVPVDMRFVFGKGFFAGTRLTTDVQRATDG